MIYILLGLYLGERWIELDFYEDEEEALWELRSFKTQGGMASDYKLEVVDLERFLT